MPATQRLIVHPGSAGDCLNLPPHLAQYLGKDGDKDLTPAARRRLAVLLLWSLKRLDTVDIAEMLEIHEAEVERIIHADREARRKAAVAA
jgi:hypothetical protein